MEIINAYGSWLVLITAVFSFLWHLVLKVPTTYQTQWAPQLVRVPLQPNKQLLLPLIFESAGAYLAGGEVTETIKSGVVDPLNLSRCQMYWH